MTADYSKWRPGVDLCPRAGCGTAEALCFHWPDVPIDRSVDRAVNARLGLTVAPAARVNRTVQAEPVRMADAASFSLSFSLSPPAPPKAAPKRRR